jgi:hypothetical protein
MFAFELFKGFSRAPKNEGQIGLLYQFLCTRMKIVKQDTYRRQQAPHLKALCSLTKYEFKCTITMEPFPLPQSRDPSGSMDYAPAAGAASAQPSIMVADSPAAHRHQHMHEVDPSLITPIKPNEQQLKAKKKQLQLQLAIVNNDVKKPVKQSLREASAAGKPLKWPPVSSAKSLPPLAGRMADLTKGDKGLFGKRNTVEFEVNQECEFLAS